MQVNDSHIILLSFDRYSLSFTCSTQDNMLDIAEQEQVNNTWFPAPPEFYHIIQETHVQVPRVWTTWTLLCVQVEDKILFSLSLPILTLLKKDEE